MSGEMGDVASSEWRWTAGSNDEGKEGEDDGGDGEMGAGCSAMVVMKASHLLLSRSPLPNMASVIQRS